jgi:hypothetical protein
MSIRGALPTPAYLEIPITVDSLNRQADSASPERALSRCIFFTLVTEDPTAGWDLGVGSQRAAFLMLGLRGILYQPLSGAREFQSVGDIEDLISAVEGLPGDFSVESDVLWVPTDWLVIALRRSGAEKHEEPQRGHVFRIELRVFRHLWSVADQRAHLADLVLNEEQLGNVSPPALRFSKDETHVFADWTEKQFASFPGHSGPASPP